MAGWTKPAPGGGSVRYPTHGNAATSVSGDPLPMIGDVEQRGRFLLCLFPAPIVAGRGRDVRVTRETLHRGNVGPRV